MKDIQVIRDIHAKEGNIRAFGDKDLQWRELACMSKALGKSPRSSSMKKHHSDPFVRTKLHHRPDDACRKEQNSTYFMVRTKKQGLSGRATQKQNFRFFNDRRPDDATFRPDETPADQI